MNDALMNYFAAHADAMLALAGQLVTQETPSDDKARLDAFAAFLADRFGTVGATV